MELIDINAIQAEALQAAFNGLLYVCGAGVVLPDAGPEVAAAAAEALRDAGAVQAVELGTDRVTVTVSVGCACGSDARPEQLVEPADVALDEAKASGRDCVRAAT